jgi:hypothetical protein
LQFTWRRFGYHCDTRQLSSLQFLGSSRPNPGERGQVVIF